MLTALREHVGTSGLKSELFEGFHAHAKPWAWHPKSCLGAKLRHDPENGSISERGNSYSFHKTITFVSRAAQFVSPVRTFISRDIKFIPRVLIFVYFR